MNTRILVSISKEQYEQIFCEFISEFPVFYLITINLTLISILGSIYSASPLVFLSYLPSLILMVGWSYFQRRERLRFMIFRLFQMPWIIYTRVLLAFYFVAWWFTVYTLDSPELDREILGLTGRSIFDESILAILCSFLAPVFVCDYKPRLILKHALFSFAVFAFGCELIRPGFYLNRPIPMAVSFVTGLIIGGLFYVTAVLIQRNRQQQHQIEVQTRKIRKILTYTSQGLALIDGNLRIEAHYSPKFSEFMGEPRPEGKSLSEVVLKYAVMTGDDRDIFLQALELASRDRISFDLNSGHLPERICLRYEDSSERLFDAIWDPMPDEADDAQHLLLSLTDITEAEKMRAKEEALDANVEDLAVLVGTNDERFMLFISRAHELLNHVIQGQSSTEGDTGSIKVKAMIALHTIKGNARTLGLKRTATVLHECETHVQKTLDLASLHRMIEPIQNELNRLDELSEKYYGKRREKGTVSVRKDTILGIMDKPMTADLLQICSECFPPLFKFLEQFSAQLASLTNRLNKTLPRFETQGESPLVLDEGMKLIHNIFPHLFANALDHGIEAMEVRVALGKPKQGTISIAAAWEGEFLRIMFWDDGGGLNWERLSRKAESIFGKDSATAMSHQELANLIFRPGLSTSRELSELSGRGIGMSAVKTILEEEGGAIYVAIDSEAALQQTFKFILDLPGRYFKRVRLQVA